MSLSCFKPVDKSNYQIVTENSTSNSIVSIHRDDIKTTRDWNYASTSYIMLQYRKWQIKDRKTVTLKQFHHDCAERMTADLKIKKTPTQIRDKINNTRSTFHLILRQEKALNHVQDIGMNIAVFEIMKFLYDHNKKVSLDDIDKRLHIVIGNWTAQNKSSSIHK